eukprot:scaffold8427_cov162-Amphora_coffeaeformis.AAC.2
MGLLQRWLLALLWISVAARRIRSLPLSRRRLPKIWLINLDRDKDHCTLVQEQFRGVRRRVQRFPAMYGRTLSIGDLQANTTTVARLFLTRASKKKLAVYCKSFKRARWSGMCSCWAPSAVFTPEAITASTVLRFTWQGGQRRTKQMTSRTHIPRRPIGMHAYIYKARGTKTVDAGQPCLGYRGCDCVGITRREYFVLPSHVGQSSHGKSIHCWSRHGGC